MTNYGDLAFKAAKKLIDRFGNDVLVEVDARIAELQEHGQTEAHNLWIEIRKAVLSLIAL